MMFFNGIEYSEKVFIASVEIRDLEEGQSDVCWIRIAKSFPKSNRNRTVAW